MNLYSELQWNPTGFAFLKSLRWNTSSLILVLYYQDNNKMITWPNLDIGFREMKFYFNDVSNFHFNTSGNMLHQLSGFDIVDKSKEGLEGINYQILDYENDSIGFYCREIFFEQIGGSVKLNGCTF